MRDGFIANINQPIDMLDFIDTSDTNSWAYSAGIFSLVDQSLGLSSKIKDNNGKIPPDAECDEISRYLSELNDSDRKMDILISIYLYTNLVLNDDYQSLISSNKQQSEILKVLKENRESFENSLTEVMDIDDKQRLEQISLIVWLRYYLLNYIYALKNDFKDNIMNTINDILFKNTSDFGSTIKLYIVKQLCQSEKITFHDLCPKYANRNIRWINSMLGQSSSSSPSTAKQKRFLPLPLLECVKVYEEMDNKLSATIDAQQMQEFIREYGKNQNTAYCFLIWFVHHYTRFYMSNVSANSQLVRLIESELNEELTSTFGTIGYRFIHSLCKNFDEKSYFHLSLSMLEEDFHRRLVVLNIMALLISFKFNPSRSLFNFLLFDENGQDPKNYPDHFEKLSQLTGVALSNDSALQQMMHIQTKITNQTRAKSCSSKCPWLFYIENSAILDEHKKCPLCQTAANINEDGDLSMNENQTLEFIAQYKNEHKYKFYLDFSEKPAHLNQPISFHLLHFLTNSVFLFLHELNLMPISTSIIQNYFRDSIKTIFTSLRGHLSDNNQYYLWFYQLFKRIVEYDMEYEGDLTNIIEFEKYFEQNLILPSTKSIIKEIKDYKSAYADWIDGSNKQNQIVNFIEELIEDETKYLCQ